MITTYSIVGNANRTFDVLAALGNGEVYVCGRCATIYEALRYKREMINEELIKAKRILARELRKAGEGK